jgi:SulP family sulfate permease
MGVPLAGLLAAVLAGFGVCVWFLLQVFRSFQKVALREIVMTGGLPEERPAPRELPSDSVTVLLPYGSLFFAAAHALGDALPRVGEARRPVVLLLLLAGSLMTRVWLISTAFSGFGTCSALS